MTAREGRNFRKSRGPAFGINLYDPNGGSTNAIETCRSGPNGTGGNSSMIPHRRQEVRPIFLQMASTMRFCVGTGNYSTILSPELRSRT